MRQLTRTRTLLTMSCVALSLALSACASTNRTIHVSTPEVPKSMLVCGAENSPTGDGVPAAPKQPYDQKVVAAYIVTLKAIIRECHGNKDAVEQLLNEFQLKAVELAKDKKG